ncbi:hypothetical protein [Streptomyces nymphaeiformis]|jgi:hypothetical protein|uniref:Uncharacterized protein n=1 Tax=Streptomyces nymphaeiformis TaxID=2663842 RepID=A0A7W7U9I1_9ACTN|nr:hypothetical protein [Streptomyces nymphaeiformis]MBB4987490.1 hypothetical protein [Streptomyces nymphaeiformis]
MRVEMLRLMANPTYGNQPEGAIVDMDPADAERRIAAGYCRPLDEPRKNGGRAAKTAAAPPGGGQGEDTPVEKMTVEQLRSYAAEHDITLGDAVKKDDIRAAVVAELERRRDEDEDGGA